MSILKNVLLPAPFGPMIPRNSPCSTAKLMSRLAMIPPNDLVTPRAFVALLQYAERQKWFPEYYASLPVAGQDGTLNERMKDGAIAGRIHAKTGSVSHVRTLTGFAETAGGRRLIFSFLSNNEQAKNHEVPDALDGLCQAMIEEFDEKKQVVTQ